MNLATTTEIINTRFPFGVAGNLSTVGTLRKQSFKQIVDTEIAYCNFSFSDFENVFKLEIADIIWDGFSEQIVFQLESDSFIVYLTLKGYWELDEEQKFQLTEIDWKFDEKENNPSSAFVLNTFIATLCLSSKVNIKIPTVDYFFTVSVPSPLNKISEILQNRQLAYRLMVIEKAFHISLPFPKRLISGEEVENIAFCYHTIVDRRFEWVLDSLTVFPSAEEENLKYLPSKDTSFHLTFPTLNEIRIIFNRQINLGQFLIDIEKAVVENYKEAKENFAKLDNQPVKMVIKSLGGKIKYTSLKASNITKKMWKVEIQKLIDLGEKFNSIFLEKYFNLATSTLDGLSDQQKKAITERPKLSIKAFD